MGLLDQVLGQVIGGMARGPQAGPGAPKPYPMPPGRSGPGGALGNAVGRYSPLVMALLALLASKHLNTGAGGFGTLLRDILARMGGAGPAASDRSTPPERGSDFGYVPDEPGPGYDDMEEDGPYPPMGRRGGGYARGEEGFLEEVGSLLDGPGGARRPESGRYLGANEEGPALGGGLDGLLEQFRRNGRGDLVGSWIGTGPNRPASPDDLEQGLGRGTVEALSRATGLGRDELLSQLSRALPEVVDGLTPHGRVPTPSEQRSWL